MEVKLRHLTLLFFIYTICSTQAQLTDSSDCSHVKAYYNAKNVEGFDTTQARYTDGLTFCNFESSTCCSSQVQTHLFTESVKDIKKTLENGTEQMSMLLKKQRDKLHNFVLGLIDGTQKGLHDLFNETYGTTYTDNQDVFTKFFEDLKIYYQGGVIDLTDIFDSLFSTLTKIAFKLYQYEINEEYAQCIADNMHIIQPFADQPKKLESQVQRAFIAVRTYLQALTYSQVMIENLSKMYTTKTNAMEFMNMTHCAKCAGYVSQPPCETFCENTMHDILCSLHGDFSDTWTEYIHAMNSLLTRMKGPFNIDAAISPIDVKISGCIMVLQDNEAAIENALERACGPLVRANVSEASTALFPSGFNFAGFSQLGTDFNDNLDLEQPNERTKRSARKSSGRKRRPAMRKKSRSTHRTRNVELTKQLDVSSLLVPVHGKSRLDLDSLISEIRNTQNTLKAYWRKAPSNICTNVIQTASNDCWDGKSVIATDTGTAPNVKRCPANVKVEPTFRHEVHNLKMLTSKLQQAYNGIDTVNPDDGDNDGYSSGDGSGDDESTENAKSESTHSSRSESTENAKSESTHSSRSKGPNEHNGKNVVITTVPSQPKSPSVVNLEDWELDILEDVLGRPIAKEELLMDLKKAVLRRHPHLKHKRQGKNRIKVAKLTENQINMLKKMLGIMHETSPQTHNNNEKNGDGTEGMNGENETPVVTPRNVVKTTSSSCTLKSSPLLLLVAFIFIRYPF